MNKLGAERCFIFKNYAILAKKLINRTDGTLCRTLYFI
jgi:hypothetical protein